MANVMADIVGDVAQKKTTSTENANKTKNSMDKEAFLQLLVAQMKYQDPLEPTSNTEYISQYATFSQVEQMQNMAATMELTRASSLVGKLVAVQDDKGNQFQGVVEYVSYEAGKAYITIDGSEYSIDDVIAVIDETYQMAFDLAQSFAEALEQLPPVEMLSMDEREAVETLQKGYNSMSSYQQSFVPQELVEKLQKYVARMAQLVEAAEGKQDGEGDGDGHVDGAEEEEGGDTVDGTENEGKTQDNTGAESDGDVQA